MYCLRGEDTDVQSTSVVEIICSSHKISLYSFLSCFITEEVADLILQIILCFKY